MVLDLLIIGGAIYYYCKKNKENKAKRAAWAKGQPWVHKDGSVTYPPNYLGLPVYIPGDYKQQSPAPGQQRSTEVVPAFEKTPLSVETREIVTPMTEKV